jgi:hypothetical protein
MLTMLTGTTDSSDYPNAIVGGYRLLNHTSGLGHWRDDLSR